MMWRCTSGVVTVVTQRILPLKIRLVNDGERPGEGFSLGTCSLLISLNHFHQARVFIPYIDVMFIRKSIKRYVEIQPIVFKNFSLFGNRILNMEPS